jgi:hypothetical protein
MLRQFNLNLYYRHIYIGLLSKNYIKVFREVWQKMT